MNIKGSKGFYFEEQTITVKNPHNLTDAGHCYHILPSFYYPSLTSPSLQFCQENYHQSTNIMNNNSTLPRKSDSSPPVHNDAVRTAVTPTRSQVRHDEFAHVYYDQGQVLSAWVPTHTMAINDDCPYHAATLRLDNTPQCAAELDLVRNMPPAVFTSNIQKGTSKSCGCTCGLSTQRELQRFNRDVDRAIGRRR